MTYLLPGPTKVCHLTIDVHLLKLVLPYGPKYVEFFFYIHGFYEISTCKQGLKMKPEIVVDPNETKQNMT